MNFEQLHPTQIPGEVEKRLIELRKILGELKKMIEHFPVGHLKISQKEGHNEFYHIIERGCTNGSYIPIEKKTFIAQLAQKDYCTKIIKLLGREVAALENYLRQTDNGDAVRRIYNSLCIVRQSLILPVTLTDEQYIAEWEKITWEGKAFTEDDSPFYTANGERVRSKSEVLIADALKRYGVPYRYEFPLKLREYNTDKSFDSDRMRNYTVYPDFMCLNVRTRGEFYWEHFGKMDDFEYQTNVLKKFNLYAKNEIFPGDNLIFTMEAGDVPLDTRVVEKLIKKYLL